MNKPNYTEVMLDLETMGNSPNAAIVAIGAVAFDIETATISPRGFYVRIDLASAVKDGGVINPATVLWWLQQSQGARDEIANPDIHRDEILVALASFRRWIEDEAAGTGSRMWGNGASFDNVILRGAYTRIGTPAPWNWWNDRRYRTVKALHRDVPMERLGTHHNALDDAISQALHLIRMLNPDAGKHTCCKAIDCTISTGYCTGCCS